MFIIFQEAKKDFEVCVKSLVDITELKREINEAKPKGDVDVVFKKYCKWVKQNKQK